MKPAARRLLLLVLAALTMVVTARLGVWQLDRAAQKLALQEAIRVQSSLPALPAEALASTVDALGVQQHRTVVLQGAWLPQHTVFLDNRQMLQRPGFFVVTPMALPDGSAVAVQRGWLPRDANERTQVQDPPLTAGPVTVHGRIAPPPSRLYAFDAPDEGRIRQNLDMVAYERAIGRPLRPLSVLQTGASGDGLLRDWPQVDAKVDMHRGYAFQWFALCALVGGLTLWFQFIQPRRRPAALRHV